MGNDHLDRLLNKLNELALFSDDFPKRPRYSNEEWAALGEEERRRYNEVGAIAIRRLPNYRELADVVMEIGRAKYHPAVPLLAELWSTCAVSPVRIAAGRVLRAYQTPDSRRALLEHIDEADHDSVYLAVLTVFDDGPVKAFDYFSQYFERNRIARPGGADVANEVLSIFAPNKFAQGRDGELIPEWTVPSAPAWLSQESRWLRLCVDLRHHKQLGRTARWVLKYADRAIVDSAIKEALVREVPRIVRAATQSTGELLDRYMWGEHGAVWNELRSHEALEGALLKEASAVATETMRRVARNTELLAERLAASGWVPLYGELRTSPRAEDLDVFRQIEEATGSPLPLSLRAFWENVGGINFVWDYNIGEAPNLGVQVPLDEMDPLCVAPPAEVTDLLDEWEYERSGIDPEIADPFELDLAPDYLHKVNTSGGGPYGIELPFLGADPVFANEPHELPFVEYLRLCLRWAGFPGLERHSDRQDIREFVNAMTQGLVPF